MASDRERRAELEELQGSVRRHRALLASEHSSEFLARREALRVELSAREGQNAALAGALEAPTRELQTMEAAVAELHEFHRTAERQRIPGWLLFAVALGWLGLGEAASLALQPGPWFSERLFGMAALPSFFLAIAWGRALVSRLQPSRSERPPLIRNSTITLLLGLGADLVFIGAFAFAQRPPGLDVEPIAWCLWLALGLGVAAAVRGGRGREEKRRPLAQQIGRAAGLGPAMVLSLNEVFGTHGGAVGTASVAVVAALIAKEIGWRVIPRARAAWNARRG